MLRFSSFLELRLQFRNPQLVSIILLIQLFQFEFAFVQGCVKHGPSLNIVTFQCFNFLQQIVNGFFAFLHHFGRSLDGFFQFRLKPSIFVLYILGLVAVTCRFSKRFLEIFIFFLHISYLFSKLGNFILQLLNFRIFNLLELFLFLLNSLEFFFVEGILNFELLDLFVVRLGAATLGGNRRVIIVFGKFTQTVGFGHSRSTAGSLPPSRGIIVIVLITEIT
mmetsp:Transcript_14432/g.29860  ORF Transcript_14432/g.29860 Transcript_14432/m.29860 type:complete len:221 (-) Transcript_14432:394-1056(-)